MVSMMIEQQGTSRRGILSEKYPNGWQGGSAQSLVSSGEQKRLVQRDSTFCSFGPLSMLSPKKHAPYTKHGTIIQILGTTVNSQDLNFGMNLS